MLHPANITTGRKSAWGFTLDQEPFFPSPGVDGTPVLFFGRNLKNERRDHERQIHVPRPSHRPDDDRRRWARSCIKPLVFKQACFLAGLIAKKKRLSTTGSQAGGCSFMAKLNPPCVIPEAAAGRVGDSSFCTAHIFELSQSCDGGKDFGALKSKFGAFLMFCGLVLGVIAFLIWGLR